MTTPSSFDVGSSALDVRCSPFADRLLTLSTGQPGLRSTVPIQIREPSPPSDPTLQHSSTPAVLDFISSDETLDRYSEIISVAGWRLDTYRRNPVFQNSHQYGDIIHTLGRALITEIRSADVSSAASSPPSDAPDARPSVAADRQVRSPHLFQRVQFAIDANPMARIAYNLYRGKFLNAVSVGFIPLRWEDGPRECGVRSAECGMKNSAPESESALSHHSTTPSLRSSSHSTTPSLQAPHRHYLEQELLEVSAVGIPANPNALALAYKSGAVEKSDLQDTIDLLRQTIATPQSGVALAKPDPVSPITLSFLRHLHSILKS